MRVLVVEDQAEMADMVAAGLRREHMAVDVALDGPSGLERALINNYDVIVLDRDLPGLHGDEVCVRLVACQWPTPAPWSTPARSAGSPSRSNVSRPSARPR